MSRGQSGFMSCVCQLMATAAESRRIRDPGEVSRLRGQIHLHVDGTVLCKALVLFPDVTIRFD